MNNDNKFLGTAPLGRLLLKLSVPTILAQVINMLYNIIDRMYIGRMPQVGELALTGLGVCLPVILIISAFAALVSSGGAPRASIFMGQKDNASAEKTLGACFTLQVILSVIITAVLIIWGRSFLGVFGASENTIGYASDYLSIYAIGTVFVQLTLGMNAFITAQGFSKTSMITVLIGAICNIALDPIFIYVLDMGVKGAALATVISQAISCIWVVAFLCSRKSILRLRKENLRLTPRFILPCLALGLAPFVMQASESAIFVCFNSSLLKYGGDIAVGAMTILTSVIQFAMMPLQGLSQGAQPIISYNYGALNRLRVKKTFFLLLIISVCYSVLLWAFIMLCPQVFAKLFTNKTELISYAARALKIYCAVMLLFGVQIACQMTFVALGKAGCSVIVAVMRKFVLLIPLIYIMPALLPGNKAFAVYTAEPVADLLAVLFTATLFIFQFRKILNSINQEPTLNDTSHETLPQYCKTDLPE